uniref:Uncharacterized protein n=1 Tax=Candidatus Methanophagaceae archaeon ANME-1 ERB6 TaxID=2759912 RepID=A0A7G9YZK6_9EURY|nr:hypothetical protein HCHKDHBN_00011 [Methanosarcinales archaeon ANME-1 ERB6]
MTKKEIIGYQFAERIKSALIISSKMLAVIETLKDSELELEGAKKTMFAFFDGLFTETGIALNATGMQEFMQVEEKVTEVKRKIEEGDYEAAYANLGRAVSHATTACDRTMRTLIEKGLL